MQYPVTTNNKMIKSAGEINIKNRKGLMFRFFSSDLSIEERGLLVWRLGFESGMKVCVRETKKVTNPQNQFSIK